MKSWMVLKINKDFLFVTVCMLSYFRPEYLLHYSGVITFYNIFRPIVIILITFKFMSSIRKEKSYLGIWVLIELWIVLTTLINGGEVVSAITQLATIISIAMLFTIYNKNTIIIYKSIFLILSFFVCINFFTLILFPNGMYSTGLVSETTANWFLGFKNKHIVYFLPLLCAVLILGKVEGYDFKKVVILAVVIISALYVNSSTTLVCIAVVLLVSFLPFIREHYKLFNMYTYFFITLFLFLLIPLFRLQYYFEFIIVNILNKDSGLSHRTNLWDDAFEAIYQHPFIGWGEQSVVVKHQLYNSSSVISAHNQILEYIYIGGIFLLLLYIIANVMLAKHVHNYRNYDCAQIVSGIYLALQIALITEVYSDPSIYMMYFLIYHIDSLCYLEVTEKKLVKRRKMGSLWKLKMKI